MTAALTAAFIAALLVLAGAYWFAIRAATSEGRHRLSRRHPGWETAISDLHALQRVRGTR